MDQKVIHMRKYFNINYIIAYFELILFYNLLKSNSFILLTNKP